MIRSIQLPSVFFVKMRKTTKKNYGRKGKGHNQDPNGESRRVARDMVPQRLPQLQDQIHQSITLRFITTGTGAATQVNVTFQNLLDSWLIAGTATVGYQLFDFVKVRRVIVRAVSAAPQGSTEGAGCTVGVEFPGLVAGSNAGGKQASDSTLGTTFPAMVSLSPDKMSAAGFWQPSSGNVAFVVRAVDASSTIVIGAIIDVELSFKNSGDVNPSIIASAIAGATAGSIYFGGIDGARLAATWARSVFIPRI